MERYNCFGCQFTNCTLLVSSGYEPAEFRCANNCESPSPKFSDYDVDIFLPYDEEEDKPDFCRYYNVAPEDVNPSGQCPLPDFQNETALECLTKNTILYPEDFEFTSNIVTDFNLVCDDQFKIALVGSIYMIGLLFSSFFAGTLADKFGRKLSLMGCIVFGVTGAMGGGLCNSYLCYCITRFFAACGKPCAWCEADCCLLPKLSLAVLK